MLTFLIFLIFNTSYSTKIVFDESHHPHQHILKKDSIEILDIFERIDMQNYLDSPSGLFRVHYDTIGENSVDLTDLDENEIPDYIDSTIVFLEYTYEVSVNQLNWKAPLSDENSTNERGNGGSGAIDVYIKELKNIRYYGVASPESIESDSGDSGVLYLDNNYTDDFYNTKSYEALKVTVAHEFHHIIQFGYSRNRPESIVLEMLSTYIEEIVFPGIMDMRFYVDSLFRSPISSQIAFRYIDYGYMYNIYFHYIHLKYGQQEVQNLWVELIKNVQKNEHFLKIWNDYFNEKHNLTIGDTFKEFVEWCYFSGERAIEGKYFPFADRFTTLRATTKAKYSEPSFSESKNLLPMGFNLINIEYISNNPGQTNDTIDVLITNIKSEDIKDELDYYPYSFATSSKKINDSFKLNSIDYYVVTRETDNFDYNIKEIPGSKPDITESPFPSPYKLTLHTDILFPVSEKNRVYDKIELQILNSNMENVYRKELEIEIINNKKVVKFENNAIIKESGIYYYTIKNEQVSDYGKFAVIK